MIAVWFMLFFITGCGPIGDKTMSISIVYGVIAALSLLLLISYCCLIKRKDIWFLLLYFSVFITNTGYYSLSVSHNVQEALLANRFSYLGCVFMPLSILMVILNLCKFRYKKWVPACLIGIGGFMFLIASSPGYLDIYYKAVTLEVINGVTVLCKEYGSWHCLYLFYLLGYFVSMVAVILIAVAKKKIQSPMKSILLAMIVFVNIGVWLLEQLVKLDFEFLSVSYIISELFLLGLYMMFQEAESNAVSYQTQSAASDNREHSPIAEPSCLPVSSQPTLADHDVTTEDAHTEEAAFCEQCEYFASHLSTLTNTERMIYQLYLDGKGTKEIMQEMNIKENTLKFHNKNIYSKLGVSSRKQLIQIASALQASKNT